MQNFGLEWVRDCAYIAPHTRIVQRNNKPRTITMQDFTKLFAGLPGFNTEAFAAAQKRNLDAFVQAGQVLANGTQIMVARQTAALQSAFQDGIAAFQATLASKDPQAGIKTQVD